MTEQESGLFREIYDLRERTFISPLERDNWYFAWQVTRAALRDVGHDVKNFRELSCVLPGELTVSSTSIYEADEIAVLGRADILISGLNRRVSKLDLSANLEVAFGGALETTWHTVNSQLVAWRKKLLEQLGSSTEGCAFILGSDPKANVILAETCFSLMNLNGTCQTQVDDWSYILAEVSSTQQWLSELVGCQTNLKANLAALSVKFREFILSVSFQNALPNQASDGIIIPSGLRTLSLQ